MIPSEGTWTFFLKVQKQKGPTREYYKEKGLETPRGCAIQGERELHASQPFPVRDMHLVPLANTYGDMMNQ